MRQRRYRGESTSIADTVTWNNWEEVSEAVERPLDPAVGVKSVEGFWNRVWGGVQIVGGTALAVGTLVACTGAAAITIGAAAVPCVPAIAGAAVVGGALVGEGWGDLTNPDESKDIIQNTTNNTTNYNDYSYNPDYYDFSEENNISLTLNQTLDTQGIVNSLDGVQYAINQQGTLLSRGLQDISYQISRPRLTETHTNGQSWGGAQTTTHEVRRTHHHQWAKPSPTGRILGHATAVDSAHAADLWFTYKVRNTGTEYAREIGNLAFNIYIGDDPNPGLYLLRGPGPWRRRQVPQLSCPPRSTPTPPPRIPLSLEQMKAIDLGGPIRIVVEDFAYGIDELFYQDAANAGVIIAMEDGTSDGDETIDTYLIPTWGEESVLDVLARYFPHTTDANGTLIAIWTPEYRSDTPAWCVEPRGGHGSQRTLWCKHALSTADWWNVYTNGLGDGSEGFQDTPCVAWRGGALPLQPGQRPGRLQRPLRGAPGHRPQRSGRLPRPGTAGRGAQHPQRQPRHRRPLPAQHRSLRCLRRRGGDDRAQRHHHITNNTVGGSGRVRAQNQVIVGSRILPNAPACRHWTQAGTPRSTAGRLLHRQRRPHLHLHRPERRRLRAWARATWTLAWNDGAGASGSLNFGSATSPTFLSRVAAWASTWPCTAARSANGESFTVQARTPRDTFQYTIHREPYTAPLVIVSYNDPQGNHRFVMPPAAMA